MAAPVPASGSEPSSARLRFDYVLRPGVSSQRLGMHVLPEEGIFELLDRNDFGVPRTERSISLLPRSSK